MSTLTIERKLAAKPEAVFDFITKNDHLLKWWGPEGITIAENELDFTRTGPWSSVMVNSDGKRFKVTGDVVSVDPPNSIELTWGWHDERDVRGANSLVRFELSSDGQDGTRLTLIHDQLVDEEVANNHESGWTSSLKKLERIAN